MKISDIRTGVRQNEFMKVDEGLFPDMTNNAQNVYVISLLILNFDRNPNIQPKQLNNLKFQINLLCVCDR